MFTMAVRADRSVCFSACDQFAVDSFPEIIFNPFVALPAGLWNIEMIDCRVLEAGGQNPVGTSSGGMAVITRGGYVDATLSRLSMNTVFIDRDRMIDQDFVFAGNVQVLMAFAARRR
jgi:hypothetical protein